MGLKPGLINNNPSPLDSQMHHPHPQPLLSSSVVSRPYQADQPKQSQDNDDSIAPDKSSSSEESNSKKSKRRDSNDKSDKSQSNFKLIETTTGIRVSQACDRCRIKKIKCDGQYPCHNCKKVGFECKTSDKLTRRAFPKGYTENLEKKLIEMEEENRLLKLKLSGTNDNDHDNDNEVDNASNTSNTNIDTIASTPISVPMDHTVSSTPNLVTSNNKVLLTNQSTHQTVQINNPIDQIFNLDSKGIIIGNDNINFESQFNHLLINLNLPFLKITNSHNFLLDDPNSYLYHPSYHFYNQIHNKDLDVIYNPLTGNHSIPTNPTALGSTTDIEHILTNNQFPLDIYDLFIKLINNFKRLFNNKKELDNQIIQYFLNYNVFIPIFDYKQFIASYEAFHTMYPFIFTYDDSTINGFNLSSNNDYQLVNEYLMTIIQIYAMVMINDPTINLNLLLNHTDPNFTLNIKKSNSNPKDNNSIIKSLYDFLPYFNNFHVSINQLQTYELFLYYSLLTNNKEKSLILSSLINSFIGILGINLNSKNLFFNDLSLNLIQRRNRVKIFWVFKVLLKCFNLKFGFKPSLNTTVINPVTIDRYFQLTPEKLSGLLDDDKTNDSLFNTLLKPSIEFLNLTNIIIPSSFSPNYYEYLKKSKKKDSLHSHHPHQKHLDWILKEDDGEGNDGNLNYNFSQFLTIDKNLSNWRNSLKDKSINLTSLHTEMGLSNILNITTNNLYHDLKDVSNFNMGITQEGFVNYYTTGLPDIHTASQLIKIQLNFHYCLIRSMNYLNFIVDKELKYNYYIEISKISREVLNYFILIFDHASKSVEVKLDPKGYNHNNIVMESLGLDVDEDGFVINDFSVKRRRASNSNNQNVIKRLTKEIPISPFNPMMNGLSMTIINLKKSMILQMLYLLICQLKFFKRKEINLIDDSIQVINKAADLFIKVFINYKVGVNRKDPKKVKEDKLFEKLMNDELKDEILKSQADDGDESDDDDDTILDYYQQIDWDDEEMDEDLKYLKILKFVKYKSNTILDKILQDKDDKVSDSSIPYHNHHHHHHHHHNHYSQVKQESTPSSLDSKPSQSQLHQHSQTQGQTQLPSHISQASSSPSNFYANSGYTSFSKVPSLSKFDFFDGTTATGTPSNLTALTPQDEELSKKEKLVINDLMNLRRGSQGKLYNQGNTNWNNSTGSSYGNSSNP
ncbi:zinc finger transcription factor [Scheffersomyces amazonensis]|uniref:zinc finger transcription factor n=1 Tax=Scheffersomyces amazonensis TaxID=1078765 RepID=UPI00315DA855